MACSNNVVRCALTPKFRDVDLLVDMLSYNMAAPAVLHPNIVDENRKRFTPPVADFEIEDIHVSLHGLALPAQCSVGLSRCFPEWCLVHLEGLWFVREPRYGHNKVSRAVKHSSSFTHISLSRF